MSLSEEINWLKNVEELYGYYKYSSSDRFSCLINSIGQFGKHIRGLEALLQDDNTTSRITNDQVMRLHDNLQQDLVSVHKQFISLATEYNLSLPKLDHDASQSVNDEDN